MNIVSCRGVGRLGRGCPADPPKIWSLGQKLHVALMSDRCQSSGNDHLSNFNTLIRIMLRDKNLIFDVDPLLKNDTTNMPSYLCIANIRITAVLSLGFCRLAEQRSLCRKLWLVAGQT